MSLGTVVDDLIEEKLKYVHVAFLAKILSINGDKAKIQPLGLIKQYGGTSQKQSVLTGVHIAESAKYKFTRKTISYMTNLFGDKKEQEIVEPKPIEVGDIVMCVCCDRNIDAALKGENALPPAGYHRKSDCVIVAII